MTAKKAELGALFQTFDECLATLVDYKAIGDQLSQKSRADGAAARRKVWHGIKTNTREPISFGTSPSDLHFAVVSL